MKPKYWHAAIVVLSLLVVGTPPALGTRYIPSDTSIGTWDSVNRIYTLTTDVSETVQIDEDNLTLDGAGYTVTGPGTGYGVYLNGRTRVRIQNLSVSGFSFGIWLHSSTENNLTDNTVNSNRYEGIYLEDSNGNTLSGNTTESNVRSGILLEHSSNNVLNGNAAPKSSYGIRLGFSSNDNALTGNATSNNNNGIYLYNSSNRNILTNNTADSCGHIAIQLMDCSYNILNANIASNSPYGINLEQSNYNTLTGNTANSNSMFGITLSGSGNNTLTGNVASHSYGYYGYGIWLVGAGTSDNLFTGNTLSNNNSGFEIHGFTVGNILTGNTFSNNSGYGVRIAGDVVDNQVFNNNFIDNGIQATVYLATGSVFSKPSPVGGNYWSDWTSPDTDGDGFVDVPYVFTGGQDDLPWAAPDGWASKTPKTLLSTLALFITGELNTGNIDAELEGSLLAKVEAALSALERGNPNDARVAMNDLKALINQVEAQTDKKIAPDTAAEIIQRANEIIAALAG